MSKFNTAILAGDTALPALAIQAGETLEYELEWRNADGSQRTMDGATVTLKVYLMPERKLQYSAALANPTTLLVANTVTAGWPTRRTYHCEVWEVASGKSSAGHFQLNVGD
jgi:hypothetical protein